MTFPNSSVLFRPKIQPALLPNQVSLGIRCIYSVGPFVICLEPNRNDVKMAQDNVSLSPTSVLRLNFEELCAETTDEVDEKPSLFGVVPLPNCAMSNKVVSWLESSREHLPQYFKDRLCVKKVVGGDFEIYYDTYFV